MPTQGYLEACTDLWRGGRVPYHPLHHVKDPLISDDKEGLQIPSNQGTYRSLRKEEVFMISILGKNSSTSSLFRENQEGNGEVFQGKEGGNERCTVKSATVLND